MMDYIISEKLLNEIINILAKLPYGQVRNTIAAIEKELAQNQIANNINGSKDV